MTKAQIRRTIRRSLVLAAALAATPAGARTLEIHDAWGMTCFPTDGPSFAVLASVSLNTLAIKGRGPVRANQVLNIRQEGNGFTVLAKGIDYHGFPRTIQAHFSYGGGYLDVIDRGAPAIQCGADEAVSND